MSKFDEYFRNTSNILQSEYERTSGFDHNTTAGRAREHFMANFLENVYPENFVFGDGEIIDSAGGISKQADVVIYDEQLPVLEYGLSKHFLSAGVMAHIEVKTDLSSQLEDSLSKVDSIKQLERDIYPLFSAGEVPDSIFSCVFAYEGPSKETFKQNFRDYYSDQDDKEMYADVVCVLGEYVMINKKVGGSSYIDFLETGKDSLGMFFKKVADAIHKNYWQARPNLEQYMQPAGYDMF
ncbi:DUF6602 domain-containing protein [Halalkalicoccus ordinarius]|uniref:DUF6602 domain-containing protein n=1 Tax=Halalkalicoccus ordinarius TaxID=3116651 RepID=UPI00300F3CAB